MEKLELNQSLPANIDPSCHCSYTNFDAQLKLPSHPASTVNISRKFTALQVAIVLFLACNLMTFGCILYLLSHSRYGAISQALAISLLSILASITVLLAYWAFQSRQEKLQERSVFDLITLPAYWINSELKILAVNQHLAQNQSLRTDDLIGQHVSFYNSDCHFIEFIQDFFSQREQSIYRELEIQTDTCTRNLLMVAQKSAPENTAILIEIDLTARQQRETLLRESEERYVLALQATNDGIWDWNLKTNAIYFSPRWKSMLDYSDNEMNSLDEWFCRIHPGDVERIKMEMLNHLSELNSKFESEYRILCKGKTYRWMLSRGIIIRDVSGEAYRIVGMQSDITNRKVTEEQLLHDALHDALTGLPNRVLFMDRLSHAISLAKRRRNYLFAVLFFDLDRFKLINDSLGHSVGDQLLIAIARRLEKYLRVGDTVARLGGDEFTILLEDIKDENVATNIANRLQEELTRSFNLSGNEVFTSASIGITLSTFNYERPEDLLRDADIAMYRAKATGKARYEVFNTTMHTRAAALLQLETDLRRGLERREFQLYYQPIVSLKTSAITGFEALIRWQHPQRGLVSPAEFIPVAEETGLIVPIGWWVLREACRQLSAWKIQFPEYQSLVMSINLSAKQFTQTNLVEEITEILRETDVPAKSLKLEITESVIMDNAEIATTMLFQLQSLGIQLSIDDFGTGYSSLAYLYRFPTHTLKIDRSFINKIDIDSEQFEIVRTIVTLAANLGMDVVAEGVETLKHLAQLKALNCGSGQGYLFSKPVDSQMAAKLLQEQNIVVDTIPI
ncbi:putative bifunctional diguanylate cyclase/phosphodiesterase [Scytonema millei]|uniref:EAL domain-containing protein n=1 Tax=Scytonema millei VB511283 TaxID=1245923 RepID=A0A9X5I498_9CYAN|nr:GGDEF and EAL domain-containing protein [Scytonema millei]NHC34364.1 EAL domain-containing protein [Scytonema millei VB511283]